MDVFSYEYWHEGRDIGGVRWTMSNVTTESSNRGVISGVLLALAASGLVLFIPRRTLRIPQIAETPHCAISHWLLKRWVEPESDKIAMLSIS